ncbi:hypothetical protein LWI29_032414 [Acer saccharum]|uniref:MATH domain-containing protein n=1 Tax=Acer saccharum TaxID=4024 RepID=A0AA39TIP2_ACESA|nr:hypothetical protein LWI29_032414 [Acer saccharum]
MANANEIKRKERVCQPAHFTLEIKSYSLLSNARSGDNYKSGWFSAGNYKWRLILNLKEIKGDRHGNGHIFLSLAIDKPTGKNNWRILVNFKLFMLDRLKTRYVIIQDDTDEFHEKQTQRDFPKFLSLKEFKLRSNGYLDNDCCTFGAEIFVIEPDAQIQNEILTMVNKAGIRKIFIYSKDNGLSLDMELADQDSVGKVYAKYKLRVKNHKEDNKFVKCEHWFNPKGRFQDVTIPLKNIRDRPKEYLKNDTLTVELEFEVISKTSIRKPS